MNNEYKRKLARHMAEKAEALLNEHLAQAIESANESNAEKATVTLKMQWPHGEPAPSVKAAIVYTTSHKDEVESVFDPEQAELGIDGEE